MARRDYRDTYDDYENNKNYENYGTYDGYERPVRKRRKKKKKSNFWYRFAVTFLGLAILGLLAVILFKVEKIEVDGNHYCTDRQIRDMVQNDKYSVNALYIFGKYMADRGEVLPCLESVKVTLKAPWHVKVAVKEKTIVGCMAEGEENVYFDKDGLVVYKSSETVEGLPFLEGLEMKNTKLYQRMKSEDANIFEGILEASQELKKYEIVPKKIVCKDGNIYLYIENVCVSLGNTVTSEKIAQITPIMEKLGRQKGRLHMENYSDSRETITFEKKKDSKEKEKDEEK